MLRKLLSLVEDRDSANNAIRDMFLSRQYNGSVPAKDIDFILKSPRWAKMYGKGEIKKAWEEIVSDGYVNKEGGFWVWGIKESDGDVNANVYVEKEKKKGEYNLVIYKSRPTRWDYFMENPQGGGFGMSSYRSVKDAISAATRKVDFKGKKKIWVIETVFDYELGENGDYKVVKSYWMDI